MYMTVLRKVHGKQILRRSRVSMKKRNPWMKAVPMTITVIFVLLPAIPQTLISSSHIIPLFPLMSVYYWTMFSPRLMNYTFLFILGLVQDILLSLPLGGSSLIFMLFRMLIVSQQRMFGKETFWGLWLWFAVMSALAFGGYWGVISFAAGSPMPLKESVVQWLLTIVCYPLVHGFFTRIYRLIPKDKPLAGAL